MEKKLSVISTSHFFLLLITLSFISLPGFGLAENASYTVDPEITSQIKQDPSIVQQKLEKSMLKLLNNPASLSITLVPYDEESTTLGKFKSVKVHTSRGNIDNVILDKADITFDDVQLDTKKLLLEEKIDPVSMSNINMDVVIKEDDLNSFLEAKSKSIKVNNPKVKMYPGKIELSGSAKYGMVKVKFWATGGFSVNDSKEIWFHAKRMKINHMAMPRSFVGMIVKKINPVMNLTKFPFKLNLSEIRIERRAMNFTSFRKGEKK
jgi:hypothetical protein